ncbi:MAG: hypothetical protein IT233_01575 [Bacteroidia bacterium]|nr:hypothetical protein [Bacteroidia bacterium]
MMKLTSGRSRWMAFFLIGSAALFHGCTRDTGTADYYGYPHEVGKILINRCANSGCHDQRSKDACAGLDLSSWEALFRGSRNNSAVIPFRPDQSFLLFAVNTFSDLGPQLSPTMPYNKPALTREEVMTLRDWIANGAPDETGFVKWSDQPNRRKIFLANQGCDLLTVFDASSRLAMRCIDLGNLPATEAPHDMYVSPDNQYLYVSYYVSDIFQKFRTSDYVKVGELNLGVYSWHSLSISGNSQYAIASHLASDGKVALLDLNTMQVIVTYEGSGTFIYPHGNAMNYDGTLAYITCQQGNFIYRVDMTDPFNPDISQVVLQTGDFPNTSGIYKPYDVEFSPDYSKYYVTCQGTNELRIFKASNDSLLQVIPTSGVPQVMAFSDVNPYVFVPCMEDTANQVTTSSVNVIDLNTNQLITAIYTGHQPRSVVVDDATNCVWVANRNLFGVGWAPHHTTACAGRNGYLTLINQSTLQLVPGWKCEVSVDPYHITIKQ